MNRETMNRGTKRFLSQILPPAVLFVAVTASWHLAVVFFQPPVYLLPGPIEVAKRAWQDQSQIIQSTTITALAATVGFCSSLTGGVLIALVFSQSRMIRASCYPYAIFLQTVPVVAMAPLIITWFGYGLHSVMIVAGILSLFPIVTSATTGMVAVDPQLLDLFRIYNASRWRLLIKLRLPNSVPLIITGARTSAGLAVVGAIVGEFFVGAGLGSYGLGYLIRRKLELLRTADLFAAVLASTLLGVMIFGIVSGFGAIVLRRWYNSSAADERGSFGQ